MTKTTQTITIAALLLSMGLCIQMNEECQVGKWCAVAWIWGCCCLLAYRGHMGEAVKRLLPCIPMLVWSMVVDIHWHCLSLSRMVWWLTLMAFYMTAGTLSPHWWQKMVVGMTVFLSALWGITMYRPLPHFTLQLFNNPAGIAAAWVMGWTSTLPWMRRLKQRYRKQAKVIEASLLLLFLILSLVLLHMSRTGLLAFWIASATFLLLNSGRKMPAFRKKRLAMLCIPLFLLLAVFLYYRHTASADGRLLIYTVIGKMCMTHPLLGWGAKAIEAHYMISQAQVLQSLGADAPALWLAGDVVRPFNEVLGWTMSYGFIGLLLVCLPVIDIWKRSEHANRGELIPLFVAWATLGMFSYPSYYPYTSLLTIGSLAVYTSDAHLKGKQAPRYSGIRTFIRIPCMLCCIVCMLFSLWKVRYEHIKEVWLDRITNEGTDVLPAMPQILSKDADALYACAASLNLTGKTKQSQQTWKMLDGRMQNYDTELLAGDNALTLHQWDAAVRHFTLAHHMVPVRFMPLYGLMQVFEKSGHNKQAYDMARVIVSKPVKVDGPEVDSIQAEARLLLESSPHFHP